MPSILYSEQQEIVQLCDLPSLVETAEHDTLDGGKKPFWLQKAEMANYL